MPELPEVETVVRALRPCLIDRRLGKITCHVPRLRNPLDEATLNRALQGKRVVAVERRAKYILIRLAQAHPLILHLGMTGALRIDPSRAPLHPHDRITVNLGRREQLRFKDARRFGQFLISTGRVDIPELAHFGPEPLSSDFNAEVLFLATRKRRAPIKNLIMDQQIVVGVGNIYASEALFRAGVRPTRPAERLTRKESERLVNAIQDVLTEAISAGGTTISDFEGVTGEEGLFSRHLAVYGRDKAPCLRKACPGTIRRITQAGRSSYYCPKCQK